MSSAFRLLARRARTESEMEAALSRRKISSRVVRRVLGRLRELGYIDDRKHARDLVEKLTERGYGSGRIRWELERTGLAESAVETLIPPPREERRRARAIVEARFGEPSSLEPRTRARAARWLAGRGFDTETIESLIGSEA